MNIDRFDAQVVGAGPAGSMSAPDVGIPPPGDALLEATRRRTTRPLRTPIYDGMDGDPIGWWLSAGTAVRTDVTRTETRV
jgi:hypothetical protein